MKKNLCLLLSCLSLIVIESCEQKESTENPVASTARLDAKPVKSFEDGSIQGNYEVRDGILYFKNVQAFVVLDSTLNKLSSKDQIRFTSKLGFKSLLEIKLDVFKSLSETENADVQAKIIKENADILKQNENELISLFDDSRAHLLNREGIVTIGGKIHCFAKGKTVISSTVQDVRDSYKAGEKLKEDTHFLINRSTPGARPSATCQSINRDAFNSDNKRQVNIKVEIVYTGPIYSGKDAYNNDVYTLQWTAVTLGRAFRACWGFEKS